MAAGQEGFWQKGHGAWQRIRTLVAVLAIIRFSLLIPTLFAISLVAADQLVDILSAVGQDGRYLAVAWMPIMAAFTGLTVWYTARTMFRFRFASNAASDPGVHPHIKRFVPRLLGISIPALLTVRVALLAHAAERSKPLWVFTACLTVVTGAVALYVIQRRRIAEVPGMRILAQTELQEPRDLSRWRELAPTTRWVFATLLLINLVTLALFTWNGFYELRGPVAMGAPAVLLLGLGLTSVTGSALVYLGNHYGIPVITLLAVWVVLCSGNNDNHMMRTTGTSLSHGWFMRAQPAQPTEYSTLGGETIGSYFVSWFDELAQESPGNGPIPVFVAAAEGGGLRAAYWTAAVLAHLEDSTVGMKAPFSRHLFAISGVSGGSVGAALFDAAVANRRTGAAQRTDTYLEEMDGVLENDFLSPTLGDALFPDLLQRFFPAPVVNDRAIALEHSFEQSWAAVHNPTETQLSNPFHGLWKTSPHEVPLLFLNSTVVETGQRAINSPLATMSVDEPAFDDALSVGELVGTQMPLSTAALLSARFTYVSPAALVDTRWDASRQGKPRWIRLVDGGYFDNSGAVTAQEIVRALQSAYEVYDKAAAGKGRAMRVVVLHLPNEQEVASLGLEAKSNEKGGREWLSEILAPITTLLNTRSARGTQAVGYLKEGMPGDALSIRPCHDEIHAPLGWVLSDQVRQDMQKQVLDCGNTSSNCASVRLEWVVKLFSDGSAPQPSDFVAPTRCEAVPKG